MARWKKSGDSCLLCDQETAVLVGVRGSYDGACSAKRCWRCAWVADPDKGKDVDGTKDSLSGKVRGQPKQ